MPLRKQNSIRKMNNPAKFGNNNMKLNAAGSNSYGIMTRMKGLFGQPSKEAASRSDSYGSYSSGYEECDNGISLGLLLSVFAALAVMFYTLYTKVVFMG